MRESAACEENGCKLGFDGLRATAGGHLPSALSNLGLLAKRLRKTL